MGRAMRTVFELDKNEVNISEIADDEGLCSYLPSSFIYCCN